jgi:hypothetical protein
MIFFWLFRFLSPREVLFVGSSIRGWIWRIPKSRKSRDRKKSVYEKGRIDSMLRDRRTYIDKHQ